MAATTYPLEARFSVSQVMAAVALLYPCDTTTSGYPPPSGRASRTAIPGTVKPAGAAGGSDGRLPEYVSRRAPGDGLAGYHRSTGNFRSCFGIAPLLRSIPSRSG